MIRLIREQRDLFFALASLSALNDPSCSEGIDAMEAVRRECSNEGYDRLFGCVAEEFPSFEEDVNDLMEALSECDYDADRPLGEPRDRPVPFDVDDVEAQLDGHRLTVEARGRNLQAISVRIWDTSGQEVVRDSASGSRIRVPLTRNGQPLANGTYLWQARLVGPEGSVVRTDVKRFVLQ